MLGIVIIMLGNVSMMLEDVRILIVYYILRAREPKNFENFA